MQSQQPWRLICSGAMMTLSCLILILMAHAQYHSLLFWVAVILFLAGLGWLVLEVLSIRRNTLRYVARMNAALARTLQTAPDEMPVPLAVVDARHEIIWYNEDFAGIASAGSIFIACRGQRRAVRAENAHGHPAASGCDPGRRVH